MFKVFTISKVFIVLLWSLKPFLHYFIPYFVGLFVLQRPAMLSVMIKIEVLRVLAYLFYNLWRYHADTIQGILPRTRTTDTLWTSKLFEKLGRCGRQNMLRPYLQNLGLWLNFSRALKAISSLGVGSPWPRTMIAVLMGFFFQEKCPCRQHKSLSFHIFFCNEK